jgi:4-amino-4-deoxy-L-arabinose transferase-like glycosyltransferase
MSEFFDFILYTIYLASKVSHRRRFASRTDDARGFFAALMAFYGVFIPLIVFSLFVTLLKVHISPILFGLIALVFIVSIGALIFYYNYKRYSNAKIEEIDRRFDDSMSVSQARLIYFFLFSSIPLLVILWAMIIV